MNLFRPQNHNNNIIDDWLCYSKYQHQFILLITSNDLCIYDQQQKQQQQRHSSIESNLSTTFISPFPPQNGLKHPAQT